MLLSKSYKNIFNSIRFEQLSVFISIKTINKNIKLTFSYVVNNLIAQRIFRKVITLIIELSVLTL